MWGFKMSSPIALISDKHSTPRVSSFVIAEHLELPHSSVLKTISRHAASLELINPLRLEVSKGELLTQGGRAKASRYALLTEEQSYFLLTLSRNTPHVVKLKLNLVQTFSRFRNNAQSASDYLPFYHELHDSVADLAKLAATQGSKARPDVFHINLNKLINTAFMLESGQRPSLPPIMRARITFANITAQQVIADCVARGVGYKETYQTVKRTIMALAKPALCGVSA